MGWFLFVKHGVFSRVGETGSGLFVVSYVGARGRLLVDGIVCVFRQGKKL